MRSRTWDFIAIAAIVVALVFLLLFVRPLLGWEWGGTLLSIAIVLILVAGLPLFVNGLRTVWSCTQNSAKREEASTADPESPKPRSSLAVGLVVILSIVGFAVVLLALPLLPFFIMHPPPRPPLRPLLR